MSDRDALLRAIIDNPADDAPRLVYADWLDEHGDAARAEYLRVLSHLIAAQPPADAPLIERERKLRPALGRGWLALIRGMRVRDNQGRILTFAQPRGARNRGK